MAKIYNIRKDMKKMSKKQEICVIIAGVELLLAAGLIETQPAIALILTAAMAISAFVGKLDKRRLTVKDIERRCKNG